MAGMLFYLCLQATREGQASHAHVHEIIKGLKKRGWEVLLFEPSYANSKKKVSILERLINFIWVQISLWSRLSKTKVSALYVRSHFAAFPAVWFARRRRIPIVLEVNGPYEDLFIAWPWTRKIAKLFIFISRLKLKMADAVIAVTPGLVSWVRKEGGHNRVFLVPNGANTELFNPEVQPNLLISKPFVIFFGALAPWQGIGTILEALECPAWPEQVHMVIIGDGKERFAVEEAAARNKRVIYLGSQPYVEMPSFIVGALASLVPMVSREGREKTGLFPLKLFESLACGVPVIVTDFPGMSEFVRENECGLVIPPGDPVSLAKAVAYVYEHEEDRKLMGQRGRKVVETEHSWDARAALTAEIIKKVVDGFCNAEECEVKAENS